MNNNIIERLERIETKLDEVIAALHAYDDNELHCEYSGLPSVKAYSEPISPCVGHDAASWDAEEAERRMDIIGQNGNEGLHYHSHHVTNEEADEDATTFNDYGMRVVKDKDNSTQDNKRVGGKKRNNELPDFKHTPPAPPKPKRKYYKPKNK